MEKIAIIGSGISGLSAAFFLKHKFDITLYEKNPYYGGHARTVLAEDHLPIDTGFIVFNYHTYPYLTALFKFLDIPVKKSNMSFGVSIDNGRFEYGTNSIRSLFTQKKQLINPKFWVMLKDIVKFNTHAKKFLSQSEHNHAVTLTTFLSSIKVSSYFCQYYLLAMGASIWSTPLEKMYDFPAVTFLQFFNNHGLLNTKSPIQWYTIPGGSKIYTAKIIKILKSFDAKFEPGVTSVRRASDKIEIVDADQKTCRFDRVIFTTHSDEALGLLEAPTIEEQKYLGAIKYQDNTMILHTDDTFMPKRHLAWSSWVYLSNQKNGSDQSISLSYWMNSLQSLPTKKNYFVTINPAISPKEDAIVDQHIFRHPVFDYQAIKAQHALMDIQGKHHTYYCGAYLRYGFHEDGILSAVNVAKQIGVKLPWQR